MILSLFLILLSGIAVGTLCERLRVPALAEMCAVGLIAPLLFPLDGTEAFLLGSVLAAVSLSALWNGLGRSALLLLCSLFVRSLGVLLSTVGTKFTAKERAFCVLAYLPKATVQAAIGGIPLAAGLACGETVLSVAVASILLTAPLGAAAIEWGGKRLLAPAQGAMRESDHEKHPFV